MTTLKEVLKDKRSFTAILACLASLTWFVITLVVRDKFGMMEKEAAHAYAQAGSMGGGYWRCNPSHFASLLHLPLYVFGIFYIFLACWKLRVSSPGKTAWRFGFAAFLWFGHTLLFLFLGQGLFGLGE